MCLSCDVHIRGVWTQLAVGQRYTTPDAVRGVPFAISNIGAQAVGVRPQNISLRRQAFSAALHYLRTHRHDQAHPCAIRSSDDPAAAGPLCLAARVQNNNTRCINYILPILRGLEIVGIGRKRPNTVWIIRCS